MTELIKILNKQGGIELLRQYWRGGALFTALAEFILLGKSNKALEILRLSASLKTKQKLEKKYKKYLYEFDRNYDQGLTHETSNKVWTCWFQGIGNAPDIVQRCHDSLCNNLAGREIIVITSENMCQYVNFPEFITDKWKRGQITYTHMADLLRLELLITYGGLWLDATVLCTKEQAEIPKYYFDSELFFYQCLKPGRDGQTQFVSSWLMSARTNNKVLMAVRCMCYEYWKRNDRLIDYFLLHSFIAIALEYYAEEWSRIVPQDNAIPHILLLRLFEQYNAEMYKNIIVQSPFHKLSYKFDEEQMSKKGTYYEAIMRGE